ncbi:MAG: hypothetical protein J6Y56_07565 [Fibrobacterales bacterium]|nr:hypothetical protein [Fibrobacterales bacterium]
MKKTAIFVILFAALVNAGNCPAGYESLCERMHVDDCMASARPVREGHEVEDNTSHYELWLFDCKSAAQARERAAEIWQRMGIPEDAGVYCSSGNTYHVVKLSHWNEVKSCLAN